ncbi:futalosine hydrolase [Paenibacillus dokdonensis]|uniref:Futalosine hydrolase n=1 Tax=Paenibacillus dokdonensis TaxID=2567944 RepID=A0ABU6GRA0_9BACL|nr:futalosine hydrolase [Paenibacillus dokdonensis]MEC0242299.1 futalosine hydrolase [Paenibacillus dokdonensis]
MKSDIDTVLHSGVTVKDTRLAGRVLIMTAVEAEQQAMLRGIGDSEIFDVKLAGFGPASAAARTAAELSASDYGLVISAGIGGGFPGKADVGSTVIADRIIAADLGAETPDGFLSVDELGFGSSVIIPEPVLVQAFIDAMSSTGITANRGSILTVTTGTGSAERTAALTTRIHDAAAEGMEGFGVATAAKLWNLPVLEIRTISNAVGPRDRAAWRMKEAFAALEAAGAILRRVITE